MGGYGEVAYSWASRHTCYFGTDVPFFDVLDVEAVKREAMPTINKSIMVNHEYSRTSLYLSYGFL